MLCKPLECFKALYKIAKYLSIKYLSPSACHNQQYSVAVILVPTEKRLHTIKAIICF